MRLTALQPALAGLTHIGCVRRQNEDSIFMARDVERGWLLAVVADGMGGHAGGAVASQLAVAECEDAWQVLQGSEPDADWLRRVIAAANQRIWQHAQAEPALKGMGTTLVAVLVVDERAVIAHIGDSRCYQLANGCFGQLTRDHSVVQQMVDDGALTPLEAERSPMRNYLARSLGSQPEARVDIQLVRVQAGDRLLLCSDGLSNMLSTDEIADILQEGDGGVACDRLLEEALQRGATDNVSVIVCTF